MPRRLAVVAGAGALAPWVIEAALAAGDTVRAFALTPQVLPPGAEWQAASIEHPAALFDAIRGFVASHLVLAGSVTLTDADRVRLIAALGGEGQPAGDAALSNLATRLQQLTGAALIGPHQVAPDLVAEAGPLAGPPATRPQLAAARLALFAARQIGALDLGQAAVVAGARVVAAEDVAGTDNLLARVARHRAAGLLGDAAETPVVLAKACKPQQPLFVDLPAIGPETIAGAKRAGISLIAVEAGRTLLLERARLVAAADAAGISVVGWRSMVDRLRLFVLAGEASGDRIGADLVRRLRERVDLELGGVGGSDLAAEGLSSLFPMADLSVMGWSDVLMRLPLLLWRARQVANAIVRGKPDVVVLIDCRCLPAWWPSESARLDRRYRCCSTWRRPSGCGRRSGPRGLSRCSTKCWRSCRSSLA